MPTASRSALVDYSAEQMYALVRDITSYPEFLSWCDYATIDSSSGNNVVATLGVAYKGINKRFTTRNINTDNIDTGFAIDMELVDGPFSQFTGRWDFSELGSAACKVELNVEFETKNILMRPLLNSVFGEITDKQVAAFIRRASVVYGGGGSA